MFSTRNSSAFTPHSIFETAKGRWLNVAEIEALLDPSTTILNLSTSPPSSPPPSGTLLLYNRSVTRNYKIDGWKWIKKRNSHKVREDHVKLRVGGKFKVSGCYVHGATTSTLHRRAYHLLNPETGTAMYPVSSSNSPNSLPSLVLVHYLDTEIASQHSANMMRNQNAETVIPKPLNNSTINNNVTFLHRNSTVSPSISGNISNGIISFPQQQQQSAFHNSLSSLHDSHNSSMSPITALNNSSSQLSESFSSSVMGLETLDFLWDVIFNEGEDKLEQTLANSNLPVDPSVIKEMIEAQDGGQIQSESDLKSYLDQAHAAKEMYQNSNDANKLTLIPEMVEIVDVTPNKAVAYTETKIVISCKDPIPNQGYDNQNGTFEWHTLAAFVAVHRENEVSCPKASIVDLFLTEMLNPYTCRIKVPSIELLEERNIIIVSVFLESTTDPVCQGVAASIGLVLEQSWNEQMKSKNENTTPKSCLHLSTASHTIVKDRPFIRFLTQMSQEQFCCIQSASKQSISSDNSVEIIDKDSDLPAPPPHMAMVATALSDFPNPPINAVLPPTTTLSFTGPNDQYQIKPLSEITDEPETKRMVQATMEATVDDNECRSKKRSNSSIEIGPISENAVPHLASAWASKPSNVPRIDTKAEEVDRHCKIRFVERLNDVISEAEPNGTVVNDEKFKNMDDQELDDILGGLLVQIVESLAEMGESSEQIHEELNVPDKSGFCMLHYAALYDLHSLIPALLSHGADANVRTSRGNLTPLHLACGAGNESIVELLVRHGCSLDLQDCFGSTPCDHAVRNGFPNIAEFIEAQIIIKERALRDTVDAATDDSPKNKSSEKLENYEQDKFLLMSAFSNLSLKDKLIFNMMVRKRGRMNKSRNWQKSATIYEGNEDLVDEEVVVDSCGDTQMNAFSENNLARHDMMNTKDNDLFEVDSIDSVLKDEDRESLDIAMKLMNKEELEDIEKKSVGDNADLREWMMKRNYESLMEASHNLKKTLKGGKKQEVCSAKSAETVRSLQNMKSQALASLVIRKNVIKSKKGKKVAEKVAPESPKETSSDASVQKTNNNDAVPISEDDEDAKDMKMTSI